MSDADPVVVAAGELLSPLAVSLDGPGELASLLASLGIEVQLDDESAATINAVFDLSAAIADLVGAIGRLESEPASATVDVVTAAADIWRGLSGLVPIDAAAISELPAPLDEPNTWSELLTRLPGQLTATWLRERAPAVQSVLELVGVFAREPDAGTIALPAYRTDWSGLGGLVGDPMATAAAGLGWGGDFDALTPMLLVAQAVRPFARARLEAPPPEIVALLFGGIPPRPDEARSLRLAFGSRLASDGRRRGKVDVLLTPVPGDTGTGAQGLHVGLVGWGSIAELDLGGGWSLAVRGLAADGAVVGGRVTPDGPTIDPAVGAEGVGLTIGAAPLVPWRILGAIDGTRIEIAGVALGLDLVGEDPPDVRLTAALTGIRAVLDAGALGGLLGSVVPGGLDVSADISVTVSSQDGFQINGSPEFTIPILSRLTLGPITLRDVVIELGPAAGGVSVQVLAGIDFALGPVAATVDGIGLSATIAVPGGNDGNLGSLDVHLVPAVPTMLGVSLDLGVVAGGGVLLFDPANGEYGGIIDLDVLAVGISAVVIIETDVPGVDGWSMFFALFLELPSIQLGFGFTLTGVGGVAGINRTLDPEALGSAVRSGSLDAVLFPEDPVLQAALIIDTFKAIFPAENDRVVFGPIVRIGWGTPTLVEAELGIVLALPDPVMIAVLGSVTAILPTPDVDLVAINLEIAGVIDFGAQSLSLSASLHDSHVVGFALSGDMELRANFGGQPDFLMSLGGFHPDFVAPAGFPSLGRLRLALNAGPLLEVSFECYLALTSNSVQFGAALDLAAEIAGFGIAGGASFDAMVQFSPFTVSTSLGFYITVTAVGIDLAGVWLDIAVKGPNPWAIDGVARFKVLGFEEQIDVHEIIGSPRDEPVIDPVDTRTALTDVLSLPEAWTVVNSPSGSGVTLAASPPTGDRQLASPDSTIAVGQRIVPFGLDLAHVGDAPLADFHRFDLEALPGGIPATGTTIDWFAPAMFFDLSPVEAISGPSFEALTNGITLGGGDPTAGAPREGSLEYEQILRDPEMGIERLDLDSYYKPLEEANPLLATAHSQISSSGNSYTATIDDPKHVDDVEYALVDPLTNGELSRHGTWSAAWSAARVAAGAMAVRTAVIGPTWERTP